MAEELNAPSLHRLLEFLDELRSEQLAFELSAPRSGAVMVQVALPRERWEIEFFADGSIEVDRFVGLEGVQGSEHLRAFWLAALAED
jgi:hypothetical protein